MQVRIDNANFVNSEVPNPRRGEIRTVSQPIGMHLCEIGVATAIKMPEAPQVKAGAAKKISSASQQAPASKRKTSSKPNRTKS